MQALTEWIKGIVFPRYGIMLLLIVANVAATVGAIRNMLSIREKKWCKIVIVFAGFFMSNLIVYIGDWDNLPPAMLGFLVIVWFCCEGSGWKKMTIGLLLSSVIFSWNAIVDNFLWLYMDDNLIPRGIFAGILFFGTKFFAPEKNYELPAGMWKMLLLLILIPLCSVSSVILLTDTRYMYRQDQDLRLHFAILCISLFSFIGLLWVIRILVKQNKLEQEAMVSRMNQKYYEMMEQQHGEIRRLKHDLANHLQVVSLLPEGEKEEYIQGLLHNFSVNTTLNYCGDATVNAVLSVKEELFRRQKISLSVHLDIPVELPVEKADICAVFANALDNAAEACERLPEGREKEIRLEGRMRKGMFALRIENPLEEKKGKVLHMSADNLPETMKSDKKNHGYGLGSIQKTVRKYGGDMEIEAKDGVFSLFCWFSLGQKKETPK